MNKMFDIDRKRENIEELQKKIQYSEARQLEALNTQIVELKEKIRQKTETLEKLEKGIKDMETQFKDFQIHKEKVDFQNEKSNNMELMPLNL